MSKIKGLFSVLLLVFLSSTVAFGQDEIKNYEVKKGDTLWDISAHELSDSFLWPKVWKANPEIPNPDRLYPGQNVKIPRYLMPKSQEPAPVEASAPAAPAVSAPVEQAPPPRPIVSKAFFINSGFITERLNSVGRIGETPMGRKLLGQTDIVYVKTDTPAEVGDRFYIVKSHGMVIHPVTHAKLGYLIEIIGIAQMIAPDNDEPRAEITSSFSDIDAGDLLIAYYEMTPPTVQEYYRKPDISGVIVASRDADMHGMNSTLDIVYLDKGLDDDIQAGDLFKTIVTGKHRITSGLIQVIAVQKKTATAIVKRSSDPVRVGDQFAFQDLLVK